MHCHFPSDRHIYNVCIHDGTVSTVYTRIYSAYPIGLGEFALRWSKAWQVALPVCTHKYASEQRLLVQGGRG